MAVGLNSRYQSCLMYDLLYVHYMIYQISRKYKSANSGLEEKQEELKVQKDEIKLLRMTVESYDSKVNEQTNLINKLEKELTNVKGLSVFLAHL